MGQWQHAPAAAAATAPRRRKRCSITLLLICSICTDDKSWLQTLSGDDCTLSSATTTTISDKFVQSALECFSRGGVYAGSATPPAASANREAGAGGGEALEDQEEKCTSPPPISPVSPSPKRKDINSFGMHRKYVYLVLQQTEAFYRAPENASPLVDVKVKATVEGGVEVAETGTSGRALLEFRYPRTL